MPVCAEEKDQAQRAVQCRVSRRRYQSHLLEDEGKREKADIARWNTGFKRWNKMRYFKMACLTAGAKLVTMSSVVPGRTWSIIRTHIASTTRRRNHVASRICGDARHGSEARVGYQMCGCVGQVIYQVCKFTMASEARWKACDTPGSSVRLQKKMWASICHGMTRSRQQTTENELEGNLS